MATEDSLEEYEGESLSKMMAQFGEENVFSVLNGGRLEPDIDHEEDKILVDETALTETPEEQKPELHYKKHSGWQRIFLPLDLAHDVPYMAGKKSAQRRFSEREGEIEEKSGLAINYGVGASYVIDVLGENTNWGADLPDETYLPVAAAAYLTGSFLQGRGTGIGEKLEKKYRQRLLKEANEYEIEFY